MKKTRVLGAALTLAAVLAVGSAMGQTFKSLPTTANNGVDGHFKNFVQLKSTGLVAGETATGEDFSLVQIGKSFLFAVQPDAAAHPSYDTDRKLTKDYQWEWNMKDSATAVTAFPALNKHVNVVDGTQLNDANTQSYTFSTAGYYNIKVEAKYPAAFGAVCSGNVRFFDILALPAPSFSTTQPTYPTIANSICVTSKPKATSKFKVLSTGSLGLMFRITKEVYNLATGTFNPATTVTYATGKEHATKFTDAWDWDIAVNTNGTRVDSCDIKVTKAVNISLATPALAEYELNIEREFSMPTQSEKVVRYTVELLGTNGLLSRKANYTAKGVAPSFYSLYQNDGTEKVADGAGAYTLDYAKSEKFGYVYAIAPSTGPVYHLGNNIAK